MLNKNCKNQLHEKPLKELNGLTLHAHLEEEARAFTAYSDGKPLFSQAHPQMIPLWKRIPQRIWAFFFGIKLNPANLEARRIPVVFNNPEGNHWLFAMFKDYKDHE